MPQMAPISWLSLMLSTITILMLISTNTFFQYNKMKKNNMNFKSNNMMMKW